MTASIAAFQPSTNAPAASGSFAAADASDDDSDFSFHDLISIINPLQHIPVVSTIYRAVTGDTIKPLERIAGDTLYGGTWGLVSSMANLAFKDLTGKDFGDTALSMITGDDSTDVASNPMAASPSSEGAPLSSSDAIAAVSGIGSGAVSAQSIAAASDANGPPTPLQASSLQAPSTANDAATQALMNALSDKGIDPTLSQRALSAYQKSMSAPAATPMTLIPTS
jgi:hypothetical protein